MVATPLQDPRLTSLAIFDRTVLKNPYIFHDPTPKQAKFLMYPHREALSGGAAGGVTALVLETPLRRLWTSGALLWSPQPARRGRSVHPCPCLVLWNASRPPFTT
jgi:hypothetical protein